MMAWSPSHFSLPRLCCSSVKVPEREEDIHQSRLPCALGIVAKVVIAEHEGVLLPDQAIEAGYRRYPKLGRVYDRSRQLLKIRAAGDSDPGPLAWFEYPNHDRAVKQTTKLEAVSF
jgi:hypothetical protein